MKRVSVIHALLITLFVILEVEVTGNRAFAEDWPVFGRDASRNAVVVTGNAPTDWDVDNGRNIRWKVQLGSATFATPVVAGGRVYIGTNNGAGYLERYPATVDLGCLLCFREADGQFLWQYSAEKLPIGHVHDWPLQGLVSSPLVEGNRLWFVSNRHVVVCLDAQGFRDGENDGPYVDEPVADSREADIVWQVDLIELGVFPHPPGMGPNSRCSIAASFGNRIFVVTGNGTDETYSNIPAPKAPSLICLNKKTGRVLWSDVSPGTNILDCQASHPLVAQIGARTQVIVPQGDGWIRAFDPLTGEVIWKFDINRKESIWSIGGTGQRNYVMGTPVLYKNRVYVASGRQAEQGEGPGRLVCIDPTKIGDISSELAVDKAGEEISPRREQAIDTAKGERAIANANTGLVWEFTKVDGSREFVDQMHRTLSTVAIHQGLVFAPDYSGVVHCLDADTGQRYWSYDMLSAVWATPLIVGDLVYIADGDGRVRVFRLSKDPAVAMKNVNGEFEPVADIAIETSVYSSPVFANDTLYVATRHHLFAIAAPRLPPNGVVKPEAQSDTLHSQRRFSDVVSFDAKSIFAPTPQDVVEKMLEVAQVTETDTLVDLGSGDGRIVLTAARKHRSRAIGYESDSDLVTRSFETAKQENLTGLVDIRQRDLFTADLSGTRVVTVFLYPATLAKLKPKFAMMKPGTMIVSHHYSIPGEEPDRVVSVKSKETGNDHRILLYTMPLTQP